MSKHKQLQDFLNEAITKGRKPFGRACNDADIRQVEDEENTIEVTLLLDFSSTYSIHDLFSKNSGLMEFVKWARKYADVTKRVDVYEEQIMLYSKYEDSAEYHYMLMGPMTAEQKIEYFLENTYLE